MKPLRQYRLPQVLSHEDCMRLIETVENLIYRNCLLLMYIKKDIRQCLDKILAASF